MRRVRYSVYNVYMYVYKMSSVTEEYDVDEENLS